MDKMLERHALKFASLAVVQQQRIMKKLAHQARSHAVATQKNAESAEANHYDWHRRVRLSRESRALNLVRAFLKGIPYKKVESSLKFHTQKPVHVINDYMPYSMVMQQEGFNAQLKEWVEAA